MVLSLRWAIALYGAMCCAILMFGIARASAMSVIPLAVEMSDSEPGNKATLRVHNDGAAPIPVEITVSRLILDEKGESRTELVEGKFTIFPPQAIIPPGATQSYQVRWLGGPGLQATESFLFSVNQLPIAFDANKSGVQLVFNFVVLVNVSPTQSRPALKLVGASIVAKKPVIIVENSGNRFAMIGRATVVLTSGSWSKTLSGEQLRDMIGGMGFIQPGKRRKFTLGMDIPSNIARFDAQISLENK
jgi:fimbrial chaperone protein